MRLPAYNAPAKKSIEISLPWNSSTNHDIVRGKLNKSLKPQNLAKPWSPKEIFRCSGYYTHNTQGYLAFTRVDISSGSASLTASQLIDQEAMSRKNAAAASTALSLAEYIDSYPVMPEGARSVMLLLKLDIISCLNYAWREAHNKMLLRRSIALDCLRRTLPPIDDDQKLALLHASFKGTTLFGGELAKLQEANTKRAATFTVFPQPTAPPASYSTRPYVGRGRSFNDRRGYKKSGGRGREQGRSTPSTTSTKPGQSKEGQTTMMVSVPSDSNKRKVESQDNTPHAPRKNKRNFRGDKNQGKNNEGVLPPQLTPVGGRLSKFVEGWKRIMNDPYVLSIVAKGYRLRFTSPPLLRQTRWEIRCPKGLEEILGMREQITLMLQKNAITEVPPNSPGFYSNVFLVRKASGGWRPVIDLKNLNAHIHAPHFRMFTTNSVLSSVRKGDYAFENRSAGCVLSHTNPSQQQKVPQVRLREQGVPVSGATLRSEHSPSDFYSIVAHGDRLSSPSRDLCDTISR